MAVALSLRTRAALAAGSLAASASRVAGRGEGQIIGGTVALRLAPDALRELAADRVAALVSATNGKTSTTRLLATAMSQLGAVASAATGANMPEGMVWALSKAPEDAPAVLEVDEAWLPKVVEQTAPRVVMLGNLSRDQLDRMSEVAMVARKWRAMLEAHPELIVVANADDPIVAYAAETATTVVWVAAGQSWTADSSVCPACETLLQRDESIWSCSGCGRRQPWAAWSLEWNEHTGVALSSTGARYDLAGLQLPGKFNASNATMALAVCDELGLDLTKSVELMSTVTAVSGRYAIVPAGDLTVRLLLAKNPAGWTELLDIMPPAPTPVIIMINSNVADGRDPSWLWDVPFERLRGRTVIASGNRRLDLSVRLLHAEVDTFVSDNPFAPGADLPEGVRGLDVIDCAATYTAFQALRTAQALPAEAR